MVRPGQSRSRAIERHVASHQARDRIAKALYDVVAEGLEFGPRDLPTATDREWLRGAIAIPIQEATEVALAVLTWRVSRALERAPTGLLDRFDASHEWADIGWE